MEMNLTLLQETAGAWYRDDPKRDSETATQVLEFELQDIRAVDDVGRLVKISGSRGQWALEVVDGLQAVNQDSSGWHCDLRIRRLTNALAGVATVTDVVWSPTSKVLYILDAEKSCIHVRGDVFSEASAPRLQKTIDVRGLELSEGARLQVMPRMLTTPEVLDPILYACSPSSGAVMAFNQQRQSWASVTEFDDPTGDVAGITRGKKRVMSPTSLSYDQKTGTLLVSDTGSGRVVGVSQRGQVSTLCDYYYNPRRLVASLLYRPSQLPGSVLPRAGEVDPTLLLLADSAQGAIRKIRVDIPDQDFSSLGIEAFLLTNLLVLPNGDLLVVRAGSSTYRIRHLVKQPSEFMRRHLGS